MAKYRTNSSAKVRKSLRKPVDRHRKKADEMVLREDSTPYQVNGNGGSKAEPLNVLDTFAGAGGFSLGFELAGCSVVGGIEIDSWASETFAHNHEDAQVITRDSHV